mmetsp:Transcript_10662/g.25751  ORF Transcript_10662/g.25751 Transcript_10662/m.25751 type:complete len:452 (+) Transcript_10662:99-1454(+)
MTYLTTNEPMASLATMFGAVAVGMLLHRSYSTSEDLGNEGFDEDHQECEDFVRSIPKVELHVHLDGAFDPEKLWKHMQENPDIMARFPVEKKLPWTDPSEAPLPLREMVEACRTELDYRHLCTCRRRYQALRNTSAKTGGISPPGTLEDMLTCFEFFFPLVYNNFGLLESLAYDLVVRQYEQNIVYTEMRYSPHLLAKDPQEAFNAVTRGLRRGCRDYDVTVNQILCAINFAPDWSNEVVDMAAANKESYPCAVVAVDIAAGEDHFSRDSPFWKGHYDMCQKAKKIGLNITVHAGETPDSQENVRKAIEEYGATRIGHAYKTIHHPELIKMLKEKNIHVEVCPTSSVETGGWKKTHWTEHPACVFRNHGLSISLNSDDPAVLNTSLTWQFRVAMKKMQWDKSDVTSVIQDSIDAAFLSRGEKERLRKRLRDSTSWKNSPEFTDRVHYEVGF